MKTFTIRYRSAAKLKSFLERESLCEQKHILVQLFTSSEDTTSIIALTSHIKKLLPHAVIIGCSSDGEIIDGNILTNNTVISITVFEKSTIRMLFLEENSESEKLGKKIADRLIQKETKALIVFATFGGLNAENLLQGIREENSALVISGALASDFGKFKESFIFDEKKVVQKGIIAVALSGKDLEASNSYIHDWEPISRKFVVNEVDNNRIYKIDNKPIAALYSHYTGQKSRANMPLYALQFPFVVSRDNHYISKLATASFEDDSLLFTSNIAKGEILQIAFANLEKVSNNTKLLFEQVSALPAQTLFVYASSARRRFLEHYAHKEIEALHQIAAVSGFFGFGEFFANASQSNLLSQSLTVLALSESSAVVSPTFADKKTKISYDLDYKTIKVLSTIAQTSSRELEVLNSALEERISKGIEENRKKDSIMIHNSKLAQLGEMMGLITHQWRQPLSAISATATGMQIKFELETWTPEYVESSLKNIEKYVLHLSHTIDDFTNFFKPTKKRASIKARDIIEKALFIMSPLLTKENISILKKYNSNNLIETYPNEVVQVILNLMKNAVNALIKREVKNPEILITEYAKEGRNIIEVSDNAGGIDKKILDQIFEPYFSTNNAENSMGLGLYMSKFIIQESCQGRLDVENIKDGVKFTITL